MQREPDSTTPAATAAPATAEAGFAAFRRDGQPAGVALAFDRTVGELLRVAAFLLPRDEVEDAVHDTYVVALVRRDRWDDRQPLLPWLLGILANEARDRRRRRRRRTPVRADGGPAQAPDPVREAQAAEFEAGFAQALRELPAADADLLRLHLCDELSCREIAERLRRPAGTVRTQVARAMGSLRRRLPVALGTGGVAFEAPTAMAASLRARVLGSAVRRLGASWLSRPRGLLGGALGVAVLFAIALPLWSGAKDRGVPDTGGTPGAPTPAVAAAGAKTPADLRSAPPPAAERTPLPPPPPAARAPWLLRGRVHDERGLPISGARIALRHGEFEPRILLVHSIADGTFELDLGYWRDRPALDRRGGFFVHVHADGYHAFPHFGQFPAEARPDQPLELTLEVPGLGPYPTVSGRVVDAEGRPVPAVVTVHDPKENGEMWGLAHADEDGTFLVVLGGIDAGKVVVKAEHARGVAATAEAQVERFVATRLGTIVLGTGHVVTGRVELRDGTPLANCKLSLRCEGGRGIAAVTDHDGRFHYARPLANAWRVQLTEVSLLEGGIWGPESEFAATDTSVRLVADAALLELRWLDPDGVELLPAQATATVWLAGSDKVLAQQSGHLAHAVVPPGSRVRITSSGGAYAVGAELTAPAGGRQRCDLQFRAVPRAPFRVELNWDDGKPVEEFECSAWSTDQALSVRAEQTAAAPGRCELLAPVGKVRIRATGMPSRFDGGEVEVDAEVPADGSGVARVVLPRLGRVALTLRDRAASERIDDDFEGDVKVGAIELDQFTWTDGEMQMTSTEPPLGRRLEGLRLLPPGSYEVVVTAAGWLPATARVQVVADKVADVVVWLQKQD